MGVVRAFGDALLLCTTLEGVVRHALHNKRDYAQNVVVNVSTSDAETAAQVGPAGI